MSADYDDIASQLDDAANIACVGPSTLLRVEIGDILTADIAPPAFVIEPLIPRSHVSLLGSHGGAGKSIAALAWCAHVACGRPWAGFHVEQGRVLYVTLEDPGDLVRFRLRRIIEAFRLDADELAEKLAILDGSAIDGTLAGEASAFGIRDLVMTPAFDQIAEAAKGCALVIIDNASDAFGGDENSRRQVRRFMRALTSIARANDAGLLLLAHIDKAAAKFGSNGNTYSGSTAWHNSARSRLALVTTEGGGLELVHEKSNLSKLADPVALIWNDSVLLPSSADMQQVAAESQARSDADTLLDVIRIANAAGTKVPVALSGPSTACHALDPFAEFEHFRGKGGHARAKSAIVHLLREGKLAKVEYRDGYRNRRERLELAQQLTQEPTQSASEGASEGARKESPIPPSATNARGERVSRVSPGTESTNAQLTQLTQSAKCRACDGEGCAHCEVAHD